MTIFIAASSFIAAAEENQNAIRSMSNSTWENLFTDYYNMELIH
jgi:hypothetical protein